MASENQVECFGWLTPIQDTATFQLFFNTSQTLLENLRNNHVNLSDSIFFEVLDSVIVETVALYSTSDLDFLFELEPGPDPPAEVPTCYMTYVAEANAAMFDLITESGSAIRNGNLGDLIQAGIDYYASMHLAYVNYCNCMQVHYSQSPCNE